MPISLEVEAIQASQCLAPNLLAFSEKKTGRGSQGLGFRFRAKFRVQRAGHQLIFHGHRVTAMQSDLHLANRAGSGISVPANAPTASPSKADLHEPTSRRDIGSHAC